MSLLDSTSSISDGSLYISTNYPVSPFLCSWLFPRPLELTGLYPPIFCIAYYCRILYCYALCSCIIRSSL